MKPTALITTGCLALVTGLPAAAEPKPKPNILLIVSDDQGYADAGFQGCGDIPTPHLDQLAREGLICTSGYVSHPFCSPTRAGLMTGRYQQRFGHENNVYFDPSDHREGLPTSEKLLPAFLAEAGYVTGWIGKWHLGAAPEFRPLSRGFKETFGFIGGGHRYQDWKVNPASEYLVPIERNGTPVEVTGHLTTAFGEEAGAFIRRHRTDPWFLYLAFNAPHTPHEPTAERLAKFSSIPDPKRRKYAAQVSLMDDAIGDTLAALKDSAQDTRTLVFFFSDNGGPIGANGNGSINSPLRAGKGSVYEGGVRVPFVVRWTGRLPAGRTYGHPVCSLDVFATALACAGQALPTDRKYDSVNLLPYLGGDQSGPPHDRLFWRSGPPAQAGRRTLPSGRRQRGNQGPGRHPGRRCQTTGRHPGLLEQGTGSSRLPRPRRAQTSHNRQKQTRLSREKSRPGPLKPPARKYTSPSGHFRLC
jgi:arylsulfatase A-like enzyme